MHGDLPLSSCNPISPWLVSMLALTCAGSVGTLPVRGGFTCLLAGSADAGYGGTRSAGAANAGSGGVDCGAAGSAAAEVVAVVVVVAAEAVRSPESRLVMTTVATTAPITAMAATVAPMIVRMRRLRAWAARRSSCRSSLRLAVSRRCSLVGTAAVLLVFVRGRQRVCQASLSVAHEARPGLRGAVAHPWLASGPEPTQ